MKTKSLSRDRETEMPTLPYDTLPSGHVIRTFVYEHRQILALLDRLDSLRGELMYVTSPDDRPELFDELYEVTQELLDAEPHREREERVLFPAMEKRGITGSPYTLRLDHDTLRDLDRKLVKVLTEFRGTDFAGYRERTRYFARSISRLSREHIRMENEILFPKALEIIPHEADWQALKRQCDKIGYCFVTSPGD